MHACYGVRVHAGLAVLRSVASPVDAHVEVVQIVTNHFRWHDIEDECVVGSSPLAVYRFRWRRVMMCVVHFHRATGRKTLSSGCSSLTCHTGTLGESALERASHVGRLHSSSPNGPRTSRLLVRIVQLLWIVRTLGLALAFFLC